MISVIIPTFNRHKLLNEALNSLDNQTFKNFEVIIVNDGGENVSNVVNSWKDKLNIILINLDKNKGISKARNVAIEVSSGDYIAFLDDDDIFLPNHLDVAISNLGASNADFFYSHALVNKERTDIKNVIHSTEYKKGYAFSPDFLYIANYIHTGSIVVRNFKNSDVRFDERFDCCEDWDLWFALYKVLNYKVVFSDKVTSIYHLQEHESSALNNAQKVSPTPFTLARILFYRKWKTVNKKINIYRDWFLKLEEKRDTLIDKGYIMSPYLFDEVLKLTNNYFINDKEISINLIDKILNENSKKGESNA